MNQNAGFDRKFFSQNTLLIARELLGVTIRYRGCSGMIVETEAYRDDPASHAITRPQTGALLRTTCGRIYIFRIYGIHQCLNFTTEENGPGAVLIRALAPLEGIETMMMRRKTNRIANLCNGPAKLCQALAIDLSLQGREIGASFQLERLQSVPTFEIATSSRVGISRALDLEWRFYIKGNPFVSKFH